MGPVNIISWQSVHFDIIRRKGAHVLLIVCKINRLVNKTRTNERLPI